MCVSATAGAQRTVNATSGDPAVIAQIRTRFAAIERDSAAYRRTKQDLHGFSLEGGELEGLYQGTTLRKVDVRFYGEIWRSREQYYFWGDSLFFVYKVVEGYDQPMSGNVRVTVEHRYYLDRHRLIRHAVTIRPRSEDPWSYAKGDSAEELLANAKVMRACADARGTEPAECVAAER